MAEKNASQDFYYPQLDGLRFFAFLLVFIHHSPFYQGGIIWEKLHIHGWIGVDIFLCLSAFLITKLLIREMQNNKEINIVYFYFRRMLRILPAYFFYLTIALSIVILERGFDEYFLPTLIRGFTFMDHLFSIFIGYNPISHFTHLWTISFEGHFYVVIPLLIIYLSKHKNINLPHILFVFVCGIIIRGILIHLNVEQPAIDVNPLTRFESIIGGIALGYGVFDNTLRKIKTHVFTGILILSLLIILILPPTRNTNWSLIIIYTLAGLFASSIVYLCVNRYTVFVQILRNPIISHLGKISYSLYLYHIIALLLTFEIGKLISITPSQQFIYQRFMFFMGLILTLMMGKTSYHFIEKPFLKLKEKYNKIGSRPI